MKLNFSGGSLSNYQKIKPIGRGAFGEVFQVKHKQTNQTYALKKIILEAQNIGLPSTSLRQISILRQLQHAQNIVKLEEVIIDQRGLYLIFEYVHQDLRKFIQSFGEKRMPQKIVKNTLKQLLSGIASCHWKRIIHRDLKPANILMDQDGNLKIADFGLARIFSIPTRPYSQQVVTLWYRAPQILLEAVEYSTPIDIWAIGCIFVELITGRPLFPGDNQIDQLYRIFRILGTPTEENWPQVTTFKGYKKTFPVCHPNSIQDVVQNLNLNQAGLELLNKMLVYNPQDRIQAKQALKHRYFSQ